MYENILVPTDGTKSSDRGVEHAIDLAASVGATVHALYVIDLPGAPRAVYIRDDEEELRERYEDYGEEVTGECCDAASDAGVECVTAMRTGAPAEEIVSYADEEGMDVIVMGSAYKGVVGGILGSTSERVVRTATVPVLTTRVQRDE